jgi:ActR/RegA family two-component response regulator
MPGGLTTDNNAKRGATVRFTLPTSPPRKGEIRMSHETITPAQTEGQHQCPPIVYLVDDDLSFLRALSRLLRAADYRVQTFDSAEEFLNGERSEAVGCVVLDLQMPGPSGLELQETLAQSEEPLPVIFLTAHGDISSSVRAMNRHSADHRRLSRCRAD